ncbi:hypothetical protein OAC78_08350 [Litorivicinus sp.]|nr:hypothetical protein [Litorivicinus sp.]MDB9863367.1 hypothetical protein [Litorivicinus sp.]MDC1209194.1 hypothetical protein [Litorivicinus sp.]MDC1240283.1 hypothetical protein [Litorivicinus sp.]MDC1319766.1 hypothetical protein [Litorivicinus sp.]
MQKWEYFEAAFELPTDRYKNPLEPLDDKLNDFGEDGWELFELRRLKVELGEKILRFKALFKRPR